MTGIAASSVISSYRCESSFLEAHNSKTRLESLATRAEGLLEASMPVSIAQDILCGCPVEEMTHSFASASVAFIALDGFDELSSQLLSTELLRVRRSTLR
jgi:hypothetical protein